MSGEPVMERIARVEEHSRMVEDIAGRFTNLEARFDRAESNSAARFQSMEARFDARFDHLEAKLEGRIDALDSKMTSYFTWMVGLTMASWLSMMYQISHFGR